MCNNSFLAGTLPEKLKQVVFKPMFKCGDRKEMGNYRPITQVSVFSKILKKLMLTRLRTFGFMAKKSRVFIYTFLNSILITVDKKEYVTGIYSLSYLWRSIL